MPKTSNDEPAQDQPSHNEQTRAAQSTGPQTVDYSLPEDDDPANQDDQANADQVHAAQDDLDDLPVSGDVSGGNHTRGSGALAGAGVLLDNGIDPELRTEMLDNAVAYSDTTPPSNVNDEPGFDDGVPNSISEFSVVSSDTPGGAARLADPSFDAGGEVHGARVSGSGGFDGGPPRATPLPGSDEDS